MKVIENNINILQTQNKSSDSQSRRFKSNRKESLLSEFKLKYKSLLPFQTTNPFPKVSGKDLLSCTKSNPSNPSSAFRCDILWTDATTTKRCLHSQQTSPPYFPCQGPLSRCSVINIAKRREEDDQNRGGC